MNVPIVYLSAFSIFLSLTLLFFNKGYKGANRFLSGYLFCSSAFLLTQYFLIFSKSKFLIAFFISGFPSLFFLIGPFAYFYVRSIFRDTVKLSNKDYLHFLLFFIIFIGTIPFIFSSLEYKFIICKKIIENTFIHSKYNVNFLVPKTINQLIRPLVALYYFTLIALVFVKNKKVFNSFSQAKAIKSWLTLFLLFFSLIAVFYSFLQTIHFMNIKIFSHVMWFYFCLYCIAFMYLALNTSLILFPQILYGLPISLIVTTNHTESDVVPLENGKPVSNNEKIIFNPLISEEYKNEIKQQITKWQLEQKFLEKEASILTLATFAGIPVHHISYYFNTYLKIRYTDWCNSLRIEFAKAQIDSGFNKNRTLEALSIESGFSSQSTFIRTFKNSFGCTPSDYVKLKN